MSIANLSPGPGSSALEGSLGMGIVSSVLLTLGLPDVVVGRLVEVARTAQAHAADALDRQSDDTLLDALSVAYAMQGQLEAHSVEVTRVLTRRAAERLLGERGFTSPEELGARARRSWRRDTKFAVAAELQALLGLGVQESYDMIALANAPAAVREPVTAAMTERGARWGEARKFWDEAGDLDHEDAADVAEALFGDDPDRVVRERLSRDEDGDSSSGPEDHGEGGAGDGAHDQQPDADHADQAPDADGDTQGDPHGDPDGDTHGDPDGDPHGDPDCNPDHDGERSSDDEEEGDHDDHDETEGQQAAGDRAGSQDRTRVKDCPWPSKTFLRELKREVAARRKEAGQHRRARRRSGMSVSIGSDGMSSLTFTGETVQIIGMAQRVEDVARRARREGAESNLDMLRFRTGAIMLMHSSLPQLGINPALGPDGTLLDPDQLLTSTDLERLAAILTGQPAVELQIITPLDAIIGMDSLEFLRGRCSCSCAESLTDPLSTTDPSTADSPTTDEAAHCSGRPVGEVLGMQSAFLSAEHLRELLCRPRSVLRRLVTDPLTGFLVHRESRGYRPDAALRAFVRARDVMCKGVGCTHPAFYADLDHVINYPEGPTSAANLNLDCRREHLIKTYGLTKCAMDETGVVRWTTFFGRIYQSEPHDYLQYSPTSPATPDQTDHGEPGPHGSQKLGDGARQEPDQGDGQDPRDAPRGSAAGGSGDGPGNVRDLILSGRFLRGMEREEAERLAGRLIYAALAHRPPRSRLRASDDGPWDDTVPEDPHAWLASAPIRLRHTTPGGQRRHGPPPDQPTPEEILVEEGLAQRVDPSHGADDDRDPWQDIPPF